MNTNTQKYLQVANQSSELCYAYEFQSDAAGSQNTGARCQIQ